MEKTLTNMARDTRKSEIDSRAILLVQDDPDVRGAWTSALKSAGFVPHAVASVDEVFDGLAKARAWHGIVVDLSFLDWRATEFLDRLRKEGRVIPTLITAWDAELAKTDSAKAYPKLVFRRAPLHPRDLITAVRTAPFPTPKTIPSKPPSVAKKDTARVKAPPPSRPESDDSLAREMERAREIQARLLPEKMPSPTGYELAAQYRPASKVGGDYYDVIQLPDGRVAILVADVAGKGISAAMVMAIVRMVFHMVAPGAPDAKALVVRSAREIELVLPGGIFVSLAGAVLDPKTNQISVVNAGHLPPKHWSAADGLPIVSDLDVSGGAIGLVKGDNFEKALRDFTITLQQDEQLVFYTDGVNEALDAGQEEFGDKNLRLAVKKHGGQGAEQMTLGILDSVLRHVAQEPAHDDITILAVRRIY